MNLTISEASDRSLGEFAKSVNGTIEYAPLKVIIRASHLSIIFSQPEQFSRLINCEFWFSSDVCFLYEDVFEAVSNRAGPDMTHPTGTAHTANEMTCNDAYIADVLAFSRAHWAEIVEVPPRWYERAVQISDRSLRTHFPHIADEDLRNKLHLLDVWRNH